MAKSQRQKRGYNEVPTVRVDEQELIAMVAGREVRLKRRPNNSYYVEYADRSGKRRSKRFGTDPAKAVQAFVAWRDGLKPLKQRRRRPPKYLRCQRCKGTGIDPE